MCLSASLFINSRILSSGSMVFFGVPCFSTRIFLDDTLGRDSSIFIVVLATGLDVRTLFAVLSILEFLNKILIIRY